MFLHSSTSFCFIPSTSDQFSRERGIYLGGTFNLMNSGPKFRNYRSSLKALSVSCSWITSLEKGESTKKYPPTSFQMNPQGSATSHSNKEIKGLCGNQSNPRECRFPKDQISVYLNLCPQHLEHDWPILVLKKYIE